MTVKVGNKVAGEVMISREKLLKMRNKENSRKYNPVTSAWEYSKK